MNRNAHFHYRKPSLTRPWRAWSYFTLLAALVGLVMWFLPSRIAVLNLYWLQRQALSTATPPGELIFQISSPPQPGRIPPAWPTLLEKLSPPGGHSLGTLLLARISNAAEQQRLLAIDVTLDSNQPDTLLLTARIFKPGNALSPPRAISSNSAFHLPASKLFSAEIDPQKPGHFLFQSEINGKIQPYDGWLKTDDSVMIESR